MYAVALAGHNGACLQSQHKEAEAGGSVRLKPAWPTEQVLGNNNNDNNKNLIFKVTWKPMCATLFFKEKEELKEQTQQCIVKQQPLGRSTRSLPRALTCPFVMQKAKTRASQL